MDIIVTVPTRRGQINQILAKATTPQLEWVLAPVPAHVAVGDKLYLAQNGFVRGYLVISELKPTDEADPELTGAKHAPGLAALTDTTSWAEVPLWPTKSTARWKYHH